MCLICVIIGHWSSRERENNMKGKGWVTTKLSPLDSLFMPCKLKPHCELRREPN